MYDASTKTINAAPQTSKEGAMERAVDFGTQ
jgi:hypothetical protein